MSVPRVLAATTFAATLLALAHSPVPAAPAGRQPSRVQPVAAAPAKAANPDTAVFAGGCFWCTEAQFKGFPGVLSVTSGYTGGTVPNPTYEMVSSHRTHHREAVQVVYDPAVVSYPKLLERFWYGIDPTQADGQLYDVGENYRTAIYWRNEAQHREALASKEALQRSGQFKQPIATEVLPASRFWPAEEYHQDYEDKNPQAYRRYREGSGRDARLRQLWGDKAKQPNDH